MYSDTLLQLSVSDLVKKLENVEIEEDQSFTTVIAKAILINDAELYIREKTTPFGFRYVYHWQDSKGNLIKRWDNVPHHRSVKTFPYHQHVQINGETKITESEPKTISDVISEIKQIVKKP